MKKVNLILCFIAVALVTSAQSGKIGVEIQLQNPFTSTNLFSSNGLNLRCFISEKTALRGVINIASTSTADKEYNGSVLASTETEKESMFGITPGLEFHVAKFTKGSVYVGGQAGLHLYNKTTTIEFEKKPSDNETAKQPGVGLGLGLFSGVDYYLTSNLYLGAEIGVNYLSQTLSRGSHTTNNTTTEGSSEQTSSSLGINVNPALRLGWRF